MDMKKKIVQRGEDYLLCTVLLDLLRSMWSLGPSAACQVFPPSESAVPCSNICTNRKGLRVAIDAKHILKHSDHTHTHVGAGVTYLPCVPPAHPCVCVVLHTVSLT